MKHITLTLISVLLFVGLMPSLHAQTATTPSGPVVMNFSKEHYSHAVLANNDQQLVQTMIKATTDDSSTYTLESIYNKAP